MILWFLGRFRGQDEAERLDEAEEPRDQGQEVLPQRVGERGRVRRLAGREYVVSTFFSILFCETGKTDAVSIFAVQNGLMAQCKYCQRPLEPHLATLKKHGKTAHHLAMAEQFKIKQEREEVKEPTILPWMRVTLKKHDIEWKLGLMAAVENDFQVGVRFPGLAKKF